MDGNDKVEILEALRSAIDAFDIKSAARHAETREAIALVSNETVALGRSVDGLRVRVEALEASRAATDGRIAAQETAIRDASAEAREGVRAARLYASEMRGEIDGHLIGIEARHTELSTAVNTIKTTSEATAKDVSELKSNLERAVMQVLAKHVQRIEEAANKLTKTPQVRTASAVAGTFAGSAAVAATFEILHLLHIL